MFRNNYETAMCYITRIDIFVLVNFGCASFSCSDLTAPLPPKPGSPLYTRPPMMLRVASLLRLLRGLPALIKLGLSGTRGPNMDSKTSKK